MGGPPRRPCPWEKAHEQEDATCNIDLWTDCIAGGLSTYDWVATMERAGLADVEVGPAVDAFGGALGEANARRFEVFADAFAARKPGP